MKKILPFLIFLFISSQESAQIIFHEDFEFQWQIPGSWTIQNTGGYYSGWTIGFPLQLSWDESTIIDHSYCVYVADRGCGCDNSDEFLYTPSIDLTAAGNAILTFNSYFYRKTNQNITESAQVEISTDGGNTWTVLSSLDSNQVAWEKEVIDLTAYAGMSDVRIGFRYSDQNGDLNGWAVDDVEISSVPMGTDLELTSINIGKLDPTPSFVSFPKYFTALQLTGKITVHNAAFDPITSFDVTIDDGVINDMESISGTNIKPLEDYSFFITQPYTTLGGVNTIHAAISNINNGAVELNVSNDSASTVLEGVVPDKDKVYFAEEGTGTWCGWCPRGAVFLDYMTTTYPDNFVEVAVHTSDVLTDQDYSWALGLNAFPSVRIDRDTTIDPVQLESDFIERITESPPVKITGHAIYNVGTNVLDIHLHASFLQSLNGDYRFNAIIAEDSVHSTSSAYDQGNDYSDLFAGSMGGFEILPYPVPASLMNYNAVARSLLDGFNGTPGSLPNVIDSGSLYDYSYSTIPTWDVNHLFVVGLVIRNADSVVLNAVKLPIEFATGIQHEEVNNLSAFVFPDPSDESATLRLSLLKAEKISIRLIDELGAEFFVQEENIVSGTHELPLFTADIPSGIYQCIVTAGDETLSRKVVIMH